MRDLTDVELRALHALKRGPMSAANLGNELWQRARGSSSCPFARPAGAILSRLRKLGLTELVPAKDRTDLHGLTSNGRARASAK